MVNKSSFAEGDYCAAEVVWDLWSETSDWALVEQAMLNWIWEGKQCAEWLRMVLVMQSDQENIDEARSLVPEASKLLSKVHGALAALSTRVAMIQRGDAKQFPQILWPCGKLP